jgi:transposase
MGRGKSLSIATRAQIASLRATGMTLMAIANQLNVSYTAVQLAAKKASQGKPLTDSPRSGRPRKTSQHTDRILTRRVRKEPFLTLQEVRGTISVSKSTVSRRLAQQGFKSFVAAAKPLLSNQNKKVRRNWARRWQGFCFDDVVFTDEKRFSILPDGKVRVWRLSKKRYDPKNVARKTQGQGGGIMVWGAISRSRTFPLQRLDGKVNAAVYQSVLEKFFKEHFKRRDRKMCFQQDNAPVHTAKRIEQFLCRKGITVLPWPPRSPDLSPIENLWSQVARAVKKRRYNSKDALWESVQKEWDAISPRALKILYDSMPERLQLVKKARGDSIRY